MVFIRAPRIRRVGPGVDVLAAHGGEPVLARQGSVLVATFHPELTADPAVHEYFCRMVARHRAGATSEPAARS
jgi:5'-phosphate synthase pdxT subunit